MIHPIFNHSFPLSHVFIYVIQHIYAYVHVHGNILLYNVCVCSRIMEMFRIFINKPISHVHIQIEITNIFEIFTFIVFVICIISITVFSKLLSNIQCNRKDQSK